MSQPDSPEPEALGLRKVIHIDMDAFYASVEQRDNEALRGRPVAVGGSDSRGVVAAASYEARKFGVRSAMASVRAKELCPQLVFCRPRFEVYRAISRQIRAIFHEYTPHVEPLALDEAYLDVTEDLKGIGSATRIAELLRARIRAETGLTASAGVSYNKLLAKLASDENKPDGICVIRPGDGAAFMAKVPVRRIHGVGPRAAEKMAKLGILTGADLKPRDIVFLREHFGSSADYLYRAARGIDLRRVDARRPRKSIGGERTFDHDLSSGPALRETLAWIAADVWASIVRHSAKGRTVTIKLKLADFTAITRSKSLDRPVADAAEFLAVGTALLGEVLPLPQPARLLGITLSALETGEAAARPDDPQLALL